MARGKRFTKIGGGLRRPPPAPPKEQPSESEIAREGNGVVDPPPSKNRSGGHSRRPSRAGPPTSRRQPLESEEPPSRRRVNHNLKRPPSGPRRERPSVAASQEPAMRRGSDGSGSMGNRRSASGQSSSRARRQEPPDEAPSLPRQNSHLSNNGHDGRRSSRVSANARHSLPEKEPSFSRQKRNPNSTHNGKRSFRASGNNVRGEQSMRSSPPPPAPVTRDLSYESHGYPNGRRQSQSTPSSNRTTQYPYLNDDSERPYNYPNDEYSHSEGPSYPTSMPQSPSYPQHAGQYSERPLSNNSPRGYPSHMEREEDTNPLLDLEEEEQYEQYQEQIYHQQHHAQEQEVHSAQQFNLGPLYTEVEMAPINSNNKGKRTRQKGLSKKTKQNPLEYNGRVLAYLDTDTENSTHSSDDFSNEESEHATMRRHAEFYDHVHDYSEDEDEYDDFDDESDEDEERPLRKSQSSSRLQRLRRPQASLVTRSEKCINRTLFLAFACVCIVFVRDKTPWWKAHKQRVALMNKGKRHHHHHILGGSDDDQVKEWVEPMAVYNTNDDDSTQMRDHDPLNKYSAFTKNHGTNDLDNMVTKDLHTSNKNLDVPEKNIDMTNKYNQATAGDRISNRPGQKSVHHGFMDDTYSNRPVSEHDGSTAVTESGVRNYSEKKDDVDEERQAFLESVMRSPTKKSGANSAGAGPDTGMMKDANDMGTKQGQQMTSLLPPPPPSSNNNIPMQASPGSNLRNVNVESNSNGGSAGSIMNGGIPNTHPTMTTNNAQTQEVSSMASYPVESSGRYSTPLTFTAESLTNSESTKAMSPENHISEATNLSNVQSQHSQDTVASHSQGFISSQEASSSQLPASSSGMTPMQISGGDIIGGISSETPGGIGVSGGLADGTYSTPPMVKTNQKQHDSYSTSTPSNPELQKQDTMLAYPQQNNVSENNDDGSEEIVVNQQEFPEYYDDALIEWSPSDDDGNNLQDVFNPQTSVGNPNDNDQSGTPPQSMSSASAAQQLKQSHQSNASLSPFKREEDAEETYAHRSSSLESLPSSSNLNGATSNNNGATTSNSGSTSNGSNSFLFNSSNMQQLPGDSATETQMFTSYGNGNAQTQSSQQSKNEMATSAPSQTSPSSSNQNEPKNQQPILNQALSEKEVKSVYEHSFYRWNHPFRPVSPGDTGKDVPVFWRVPRSASGAVESVLSFCYRLVLASSMGIAGGHAQDTTLDVITLGTGADYVNVDMSRPAGIQRAKEMDLASSSLTDMTIISTPFLFETAEYIFRDNQNDVAGKCFTLLRHPVDRAVSMYHHYQIDESGNPNTGQYKGMTIDDFAENVAENNWMVRFLANKRSGALTWHDLEAAKEVFGRKCLVGLVDKAEESLKRYERFFRWDEKFSSPNSDMKMSASVAKDKCVQQYLTNSDTRKNHPTYEGTTAWEALRKKNEYDVLLYEYAKNLYTQQSTIYEKMS